MNREDFIFPDTQFRDSHHSQYETQKQPPVTNTPSANATPLVSGYSNTVVYIMIAVIVLLIILVLYMLWGGGGSNSPQKQMMTSPPRPPQQKPKPKPKEMPKMDIEPEDLEEPKMKTENEKWLASRRRVQEASNIQKKEMENAKNNGVDVNSAGYIEEEE